MGSTGSIIVAGGEKKDISETLADKKALIAEIKDSINLLDEKLLENDFM